MSDLYLVIALIWMHRRMAVAIIALEAVGGAALLWWKLQ